MFGHQEDLLKEVMSRLTPEGQVAVIQTEKEGWEEENSR